MGVSGTDKAHISARQADELGERLCALLHSEGVEAAYSQLAPVLAQRTPFPILGRIGQALGDDISLDIDPFLDHIAAQKTEGGWVVIGTALGARLKSDLPHALKRSQEFIIAADIWYGADILGERIPGPALLSDFQPTLDLLAPWREHENRWVRRTVGVAAHFWAKRTGGAAEHEAEAQVLLDFLAPLFGEWEIDVVKGVGWGFKTLGRYYPALTAECLAELVKREERHRALMLRKALTYLPPEQRARITGGAGG